MRFVVPSFFGCGLSAESTPERVVVAYLSLLSQLQAVLIAADCLEAQNDSPTHLFSFAKEACLRSDLITSDFE
jgi:hypothetical protein